MADLSGVLADLSAEGDDLDRMVATLGPEQWAMATPAPGWDVATQIAHLAWTDEMSILAVSDPVAFMDVREVSLADADGFVDAGAREVARLDRTVLIERWRTGRAELVRVLAGVPDGARIAWFGPPMSAASMTTARLMETWAHGQDVADALGVVRTPTARLRNIAHIGVRTRDFAFVANGIDVPTEPFRVELDGPDGQQWSWGPEDADQRVEGPAVDFALLVTRRRHRDDLSLRSAGADAAEWLRIAQAFAGPAGPARAAGEFARPGLRSEPAGVTRPDSRSPRGD